MLRTSECRWTYRVGLRSEAVVTLAMLSGMRTVHGLPEGFLFVADANALNCWTYRVIDFLDGTLSFRPISKCCRNKCCIWTTLSPLFKNVSITNARCSFDQCSILTGNALNSTTHWYQHQLSRKPCSKMVRNLKWVIVSASLCIRSLHYKVRKHFLETQDMAKCWLFQCTKFLSTAR